MYEVKDGSRILRFEGELLGSSTSYRRGSDRWIEFELYKTLNGSYVLSRVGVSLVFHASTCSLVRRYGLSEASPKALHRDALPCEECDPSRDLPIVYPEKNRTWTQVSEEPEAVLDSLYKYDSNNTRYLTKVAQRLLEQASEKDSRIEAVYRIETIP